MPRPVEDSFAPKAALRRQYLQWREQLSEAEWQERSHRLCQHLSAHPQFQAATTILTYVPHRREPDLRPLWRLPKRWGLPRVVGKRLVWHELAGHASGLAIGRYGILEPAADWPTIEPTTVDLCLVPAIACDRHGYRLGYGAGFFDRLFADLQWQSIPRWGIVFAATDQVTFPVDAWDSPLTAVCSEEGLRFPAA
ncbi:5-formyltetrahydrofolate cyclo-ligase [Thermosynechococcaceae cyanobacterium Okahandja]